MRDKLIELIGDAPYGLRTLGQAADELISVESIADYLIANGVTFADVPDKNVGKWIPVSERLPEEDGIYLISVNTEPKGIYSRTAWYFTQNEQWLAMQEVTHWMPMPEPPKEGEA